MIILTFQSKDVLEKIKSTGRYYCEVDNKDYKQTPLLYKDLGKLLFEKTGINTRPIFGWSQLTDDYWRLLPLENVTAELIKSAVMKVGFEDYLAFHLDVPDNLVVNHEFYYLEGLKLDEKEAIIKEKDLRNYLDNRTILDNEDAQASFPYIDKSLIKGVYEYELGFGIKHGFKVLKIKKVI